MPEPHHKALAPVFCDACSAALKSVITWKQYPSLGPGTWTLIEHSAWINKLTPSSRGSVLLFNGKSALQTQLNCSSGMKFTFRIVQCHPDTVKFYCKYWCEKYLLRALNHAVFHTFFCLTKLYTQPVRYKFHPHSLVILIKHALKILQSSSHHWKCVIENCVCRMCFLKKLWMPYFKMINAPWAVTVFLKALNCNPYWKQEASSSDQEYKCLEMTKYSVFSKIHRDLSKFNHSVHCEMLTIT